MKVLPLFFLALTNSMDGNADTLVGERCYAIEPAGSEMESGIEDVAVYERGDLGSGIFDAIGFFENESGVRTPIVATSYRVDDGDGHVFYNRISYGVLGNVNLLIALAQAGNVFDMADVTPMMATYSRNSVLNDDGAGGLIGSFRTDIWHHDNDQVEMTPSTTSGPGIIYSIPCQE
jgi:hypothetical protein